MATEVTMPKLGLTMEEGTVLNWKKKVGESVRQGEVLLIIQTDKVEYDVEAPAAGTVLKLLANEGDVIPTGQVIAFVGKEGEEVGDGGAPAPSAPPAVEAAKPVAAVAATPATPTDGGRIFISPLARKMAKEMGIDYSQISGSGPKGRIVKDDILRAAEGAPAAPGAAAAPVLRMVPPSAPAAPGGILHTIPVRGMRCARATRRCGRGPLASR
jgi:pyruvate dehydrogenase E2 component (dihydrolipoamide acetyltransferase)